MKLFNLKEKLKIRKSNEIDTKVIEQKEELKPNQTKSKIQTYTPEYKDKLFLHKKSRLKMRKKSQRINRGT